MSRAREAIEHLIFSYAERIDAGDLEGVADLFRHAELTFDGTDIVRRGREQALEQYVNSTRIYEDTGTPRTRHVTTNLIIEVNEAEGRASCRSCYTVFQQTPELPLQPIIGGRYHDRFARVGDEWRFSHRHIFCDLFGNLSHHLLFDLSSALSGDD